MFHYHFFKYLILLVMVISVLPQSAHAAPAIQNNCEWQTPSSLKRLVTFYPPWTRGDREFDGHGPDITASVNLVVHPTGIFADIYMKAKETKSDWTTGEGKRRIWFYNAPKGYSIKSVAQSGSPYPYGVVEVNQSYSWQKSYRDNNHSAEEFTFGANKLLSTILIIGDTKGDDVGRNTRIEVLIPITAVCLASGDTYSPYNAYAVVCLINNTSRTVTYEYDWGGESRGANRLRPNDSWYYYWTYETDELSSPRFNIRFDSGGGSTRYKEYYLLRNAASTRNCNAAKKYSFGTQSDGSIDLFQAN